MSRTRKEGEPSTFNRSTEKALSVIELLAIQGGPMRLTDIASRLGFNQSTALRFLSSLINSGYVAQNPQTQQYYLTYKISRIANMLNAHQDIAQITHPYIEQLSEAFGESACISIEQQFKMVYIDVVTGKNKTLLSSQQIGNTSLMHCTGNGKLLLATFSEEKLDQFISEAGLEALTKNTITTKPRLMQELDIIRKNGYALDNEECEIGVRCIAYPLRNYTGNIIAGMSVTGPITRMSKSVIAAKQPMLERISAEISYHLGYKGD